MFHRKIYQLCEAKCDVCMFIRDQNRWIDQARIVDIEGDIVTVRYTEEDEDEVRSLEEFFRLESIGSVMQRLSSVPKSPDYEILVSDDCPASEQVPPRSELDKP
ncbi:MAG: hypothetical protein HC919_11230 [Oscillatoriales cyanobacterium SM2_2_1]|nr:hypothetical protein [Oscillatoriales cyanobacterium SM2_2_1]